MEMGSRTTSHQLSSGLYVLGRPKQQFKERPPIVASRAMPYTGGDVKKSGELGRLFDIHQFLDPSSIGPPPPKISRPSSSSSHSEHINGSVGSRPNFGLIPKKSSGPMPLQPTGLITSGPIGSSPLGSSTGRRSGHMELPGKAVYVSSVTSLAGEKKGRAMRVPKAAVWVVVVVAVAMGLLVGAFLMAVKKAVVLVVVGDVLVLVAVTWNCVWGRRELLGFVRGYPDAELRGAIDGQYIKVIGE